MKINELLKPKTTEEKRAAWERITDARQSFYKELYDKEQDKDRKHKIMTMRTLELQGGNCPSCKQEWLKCEFDNQFLCGFYYIPVCECYIRCPECKSELYDLQLKYYGKVSHCDNCGFQLYNHATKTKRYGGEFEIYYGGLPKRERLAMWHEKNTPDSKRIKGE